MDTLRLNRPRRSRLLARARRRHVLPDNSYIAPRTLPVQKKSTTRALQMPISLRGAPSLGAMAREVSLVSNHPPRFRVPMSFLTSQKCRVRKGTIGRSPGTMKFADIPRPDSGKHRKSALKLNVSPSPQAADFNPSDHTFPTLFESAESNSKSAAPALGTPNWMAREPVPISNPKPKRNRPTTHLVEELMTGGQGGYLADLFPKAAMERPMFRTR